MSDHPTLVMGAPGRPAGGGPPPGAPAVPGFVVTRLIGRGGMGAVFEARDRTLGRTVALKVLSGAGLSDPGARLRFLSEAAALAAVRHPGLVQIHDAGTAGPDPYLVLEYVRGESLADRLRRGPLPPIEAATVVRAVAEAVHSVHDAGLVHRDLKPGNILLPADAPTAPKLVDFGLARVIGQDSRLTRTGETVGTPHYMAPEQVRGDPGAEPAADVYALGAVLYELLTGHPPFAGQPVPTLFQSVLTRDPLRPRAVPPDLATVALKCLEKEPGRRYPSAAALADDLTRYLTGRPVTARPVGPAERAVRWARRNRLAAGLMAGQAAALVAVGGLAAVALVSHREADRERGRAETNLAAARRVATQVVERLVKDDSRPSAEALADRRQWLADLRPVFERFLAQRPDDPAVRTEQADAAGVWGDLEVAAGDHAAAGVRYAESDAILRQLVADRPHDPDHRAELGNLLVRVGIARQAAGDPAAVDTFAEAVEVLTVVLAAAPGRADRRLALAQARAGLALNRAGDGDPADVAANARAILDLLADHPSPDAHSLRAIAHGGLALFDLVAGRTADALRQVDAGVDAARRGVAAAGPARRPQVTAELGTALATAGLYRVLTGQPADAGSRFDEAIDLLSRATDLTPAADTRRRATLGLTLVHRGRLAQADRPDACRADLRRALDVVGSAPDARAATVRHLAEKMLAPAPAAAAP